MNDDLYDEKETARRRDAVIRRMTQTPPDHRKTKTQKATGSDPKLKKPRAPKREPKA